MKREGWSNIQPFLNWSFLTMTQEFDPNKLVIPPDFVVDKEAVALMKRSIQQRTLMHPPCVKDNGEVFAGEVHVLACRELDVKIDCRVFPSNLTSEEYHEISIHKRLQSPTTPWDVQVTLEKQLHDIRVAQKGAGKQGKKVGWSLRDTAEELNMSFGILSEDIRMADAISADPSLRRIKDKTTARRVILGNIKRENQQVQASAPVQVDTNVIIHGGSEAVLRVYPDNTFDACITDPPWLEFKDPSLERDKYTLPVFQELYKVLKPNSFLYAFVSTQDWYYYFEKLTVIGFNVQKYPLMWVKEGVLTQGTLSWQHQRDYEPIILAVKGSPALTSNMLSAVFTTKVVHSSRLIHPNEKPTEVIEKILNCCTYEGSLVVDPFAGSGVVLETCERLRRRWVGVENNLDYFNKIKTRMKK
jgi:site-specific DNA-methyltransferase (adenine-specific)